MPNSVVTIVVTIVIQIATTIPAQMVSTLKPSTNRDASHTMTPFRRIAANPSVRTVIGSANRIRRGQRSAFRIPIHAAPQIAALQSSTS